MKCRTINALKETLVRKTTSIGLFNRPIRITTRVYRVPKVDNRTSIGNLLS